jgi:hypothetical protein
MFAKHLLLEHDITVGICYVLHSVSTCDNFTVLLKVPYLATSLVFEVHPTSQINNKHTICYSNHSSCLERPMSATEVSMRQATNGTPKTRRKKKQIDTTKGRRTATRRTIQVLSVESFDDEHWPSQLNNLLIHQPGRGRALNSEQARPRGETGARGRRKEHAEEADRDRPHFARTFHDLFRASDGNYYTGPLISFF